MDISLLRFYMIIFVFERNMYVVPHTLQKKSLKITTQSRHQDKQSYKGCFENMHVNKSYETSKLNKLSKYA